MNWEAIGAVGEVVGAAGVLATLVYLSLQIRAQNEAIRTQNDAMRIQNMRQRASELRNVGTMQATTETIERAVVKAYVSGDPLTPEERHGLESYVYAILAISECDFRLYRDGLIPNEEWIATKNNLKLFFYAPAARSWWEEIGHQIVAESFRPEVEAAIKEIAIGDNPYAKKSASRQA